MQGKTYPEVRKFLLGPRGTTVKVTVENPATKTKTVSIVRDAVSLPSIAQAYMLRSGVGYVAMTGGFNLTTDDEFQEALRELHNKGMNMLVLDLRGNRGGLLIQAACCEYVSATRPDDRFAEGLPRQFAIVQRSEREPDNVAVVVLLTARALRRRRSLPVRFRITIARSSSAKRPSAKVSYSFHSSWITTRLCC